MRRIALAVLCALLLVGGSTSGALATTTRIHVATAGHTAVPLHPGTTTMNGSVMSVRGLVLEENGAWHDSYADGVEVNTVNYDLDLVSGSGTMWGTGIHFPVAFPDATWRCSFEMTFTHFVYAGKGVC
jgi:hypothetical protein